MHQNLSEEKKNKKRQYTREKYLNLSKDGETKSKNIVANTIKISLKMKNKSYLSNVEKITAKSLNDVSVFSYNSSRKCSDPRPTRYI